MPTIENVIDCPAFYSLQMQYSIVYKKSDYGYVYTQLLIAY